MSSEEGHAEKRDNMGQVGDMIVNLMRLPEVPEAAEGVQIKRALIVDKGKILDFIKENFPASPGWMWEAEKALMQNPGQCFIAVKNKEVVGFACYDTTAPDYFGPTGVRKDMRGQGIGTVLLLCTLHAMRNAGYGYAIIGAVGDAADFYQRVVGASYIVGADLQNTVYSQLIKM